MGALVVPGSSGPTYMGGVISPVKASQVMLPSFSSQGLAVTQSRLHVHPVFVPKAITIDNIYINVTSGVASSVFRAGIYQDTGDYFPGALLLDAGTVDTSTNGIKTYTISQALAAGTYWLAGVSQGGAPGISIASAATDLPHGYIAENNTFVTASPYRGGWFQASVTGALPGTFAGSSITSYQIYTGWRVAA